MLHASGGGAALTAPCLSIDGTSAPAAPPAAPTARERVLRLAARLLPCASVNPAIAKLDRIAAELRGVRRYYLHDVETCASIDAWLELWGSR